MRFFIYKDNKFIEVEDSYLFKECDSNNETDETLEYYPISTQNQDSQ